MTNSYTTSTDAFADIPESSYGSSTDASIAAAMSAMIVSVSRLIDATCGKEPGFFYPTTDSVSRYFDGSGGEEQDIDPYVSISAVAVAETGGTASSDYTAWGSSDYMTWPYNFTPITKLIIDSNGSKGGWYGYRKAVKVTGVPGYASTTPALIAQACKTQAIRWFMRGKQGWQDSGTNENVGGLTFKAELDPDVKLMLMPFILELS